jgi:hypothetical protein
LLYEKFIIFPKAFYLTAEHGGTACEKDAFTLQFQALLRPSLLAPESSLFTSRSYPCHAEQRDL